MSVAFNEEIRKLLDGRNFATVATLNPDGGPQTSVVWIARDGDAVLFSTTAGRQKARNLTRDPRISLTVYDTGNPYHSVDIRGTVELIEDPPGESASTAALAEVPRRGPASRVGRCPPVDRPGDSGTDFRLRCLRAGRTRSGRLAQEVVRVALVEFVLRDQFDRLRAETHPRGQLPELGDRVGRHL